MALAKDLPPPHLSPPLFSFSGLSWVAGTPLSLLKAKNIYASLTEVDTIFLHLNKCWELNWEPGVWKDRLGKFWMTPNGPKKLFFGWRMMLNKLSIKDKEGNYLNCKIFRIPETMKHILFYCHFAKEIWNLFGLNLDANCVEIINVVLGYIKGCRKTANIFWSCLSLEVLWLIWKYRNDDVFNNNTRHLTESLRRLIFHTVSMQVTIVIKLDSDKFDKWIKEGATIIYI